VENAVGAHLLNNLHDMTADIYYWRKSNAEVDFVIQTPGVTWAIEVKAGRMRHSRGLEKFLSLKKDSRPFIIGGTGMPLEEFFTADPKDLFL
jgi:predicted AAA+ superfamily ATPase